MFDSNMRSMPPYLWTGLSLSPDFGWNYYSFESKFSSLSLFVTLYASNSVTQLEDWSLFSSKTTSTQRYKQYSTHL